jgi:hypothetical protein
LRKPERRKGEKIMSAKKILVVDDDEPDLPKVLLIRLKKTGG